MSKVTPITVSMIMASIQSAPEVRFIILKGRTALQTAARICRWHQLTLTNLLKAYWFVSHLACAVGFSLSLFFPSNQWYYLAVCGATSTYTVSCLRHLLVLTQSANEPRDEIPLASFLNAENTLLLLATGLHMTSMPHPLKIFSFAVFAYMNLVSYVLHEAISANAFTTALLPVLMCMEPFLLGIACCSDYIVLVMYYKEYFSLKTSLLYGIAFSYINFKRLERSELSRVSLYNMFEMFAQALKLLRMPHFIRRAFLKLQSSVYVLVPREAHIEPHLLTGRSSVRTRATSIFFEPIPIINDVE